MKNASLLIVFFLALNLSFGQETNQAFQEEEELKPIYTQRKNIPKFAPTSLVFRNFQFQYERVLNQRFSVALTYSTIPEGDFPFKDLLLESADEEEDLNRYLENSSIKYTSFTPEIRIYFGDGYGKGFYLAPFYRHTNYDLKGIQFYYDSDEGNEEVVVTSGELKSNTFGLQVGSQFNLGNRLVLDWFIIGPHYGTSNGDLLGRTTETLSEQEQQDLDEVLSDIDMPVGDFTHEVDSRGANIKVDGPWGGIRAGIAIGYRF
ncbi:DUF3575 domain-containing protein [Gramella sp. GC03-9]|uniref:DUF3575 domain-containing protein n=1 Tax=Christiangramia oceanisediminis TaxID=2920386 RepID=A0A9X2KWR5_9FLAO|nr:DUF3575 domain-containing protein [Gramella oceanisediminis]MCP9199769.1 DUF3575 domain-containing protein [Gramella oceanisediminis]